MLHAFLGTIDVLMHSQIKRLISEKNRAKVVRKELVYNHEQGSPLPLII